MKTLKELLNTKISEGFLPSTNNISQDFFKSHIEGYEKIDDVKKIIYVDDNDNVSKITFKKLNKQLLSTICDEFTIISPRTSGSSYSTPVYIIFEDCFISFDEINKLLKDGDNNCGLQLVNLNFENCNFENGALDLSDYLGKIYNLTINNSNNIKTIIGPKKEDVFNHNISFNFSSTDCPNLSKICNIKSSSYRIQDCLNLKKIENCYCKSLILENVGIEELNFDNKMFDFLPKFDAIYNIQIKDCNNLSDADIPFCERSYVSIQNCNRLISLNFKEQPVKKMSGMESYLLLTNNRRLRELNDLPKKGITGIQMDGCYTLQSLYEIKPYFKAYKIALKK